MKNKLIIGAFLAGTCISTPVAMAEGDQIIHLEGTVFSRSATIPAGTSSAVLYEVHRTRILIVTQFCKNNVFGPELVGSKLGRVPAGTDTCTTYVPGVQFKGRQTISCVADFPNPDMDVTCLINGVLQIIQ